MSNPAPASSSSRLRALEQALERDPDSFAARFERASLFREQGRYEEAKGDYLELLRRKPDDFGALNDFGTLVLKAGYRDAARSLFGEAVRYHPDNPNGRVNLANLLFALEEFDAARAQFEAALAVDPSHIHAHRGMSYLLAAIGEEAAARSHRDLAFENHFLTTLPYRGEGRPIKVLLLISAAGGNIPVNSLLDDRTFETTVVAAEYAGANFALPPHDLLFNSIGDADLCREGLEIARSLVARTSRYVINHPTNILKTGRLSNADRLRGIPGVITPRMLRLPRRVLAGADAVRVAAAAGFVFPFLVRAPGFHTGQYFTRVATAEEFAAALAKTPGEEVWLIEELDARDGDGMFRKFRAMIVDRRLYPLHLAISRNWKVHYFRADMAQSEDNRRKDAAFLDDMANVIGIRGMQALEEINAALDLDYGGVDFAVDAHGNILLFEANATMVMIPLAPDEKWAYRRSAFDGVFAAIRKMLLERAAASPNA